MLTSSWPPFATTSVWSGALSEEPKSAELPKRKYTKRADDGPPPEDLLLISEKCHLLWLETLRSRLDSVNRELLKESCFGIIGNLPAHFFHAVVYQELLMMLDRNSLANNILTFVIHRQTLRFWPMEFGLTCGLKFKGWYASPVSSFFHDGLFDSRLDLALFHVQEKYRVECAGRKGSDPTCLKLTLLNILYGVLLTSVSRGGIISPGLSIVLLFWAFEVVLDLGVMCGRKLKTDGERILHLSNWLMKDYIDAERIKKFFRLRRKTFTVCPPDSDGDKGKGIAHKRWGISQNLLPHRLEYSINSPVKRQANDLSYH
ncbi:hypothetical protein C2S52_015545 [Perilla frutescens var. hirtella]|nr:hypothetical protein C2S52_015545 [Perilla frutescens var. hirtella]KAH6815637.1 hypothetical protein C2S51_020457 [Perilla frutescens var. frutescens]